MKKNVIITAIALAASAFVASHAEPVEADYWATDIPGTCLPPGDSCIVIVAQPGGNACKEGKEYRSRSYLRWLSQASSSIKQQHCGTAKNWACNDC